jgi:two-component sensor histidine kinase
MQFRSCARLCARIARIGDECRKARLTEHRRWDRVSALGHYATTTEPTVHFRWQERGGPAVTLPKRKGFGTVLLERAVATTSAVRPPRFDYSPEGFSYEVKAILAEPRVAD